MHDAGGLSAEPDSGVSDGSHRVPFGACAAAGCSFAGSLNVPYQPNTVGTDSPWAYGGGGGGGGGSVASPDPAPVGPKPAPMPSSAIGSAGSAPVATGGVQSQAQTPYLSPNMGCILIGECVRPRDLSAGQVAAETAVLGGMVVGSIFAPEIVIGALARPVLTTNVTVGAADAAAGGVLGAGAVAVTAKEIAAASSGVRILDRTGNHIVGAFRGAKGEAQFITELVRDGDTLIFRGTHIEGLAALRESLEVAKAFGREQGAKRIIIEGGKRTTGANPGHVPRPIELETGL